VICYELCARDRSFEKQLAVVAGGSEVDAGVVVSGGEKLIFLCFD